MALSDRDLEEHSYEQNTKVKIVLKRRGFQPIH